MKSFVQFIRSRRGIVYIGLSMIFLLLTNIASLNFKSHEKPGFTYTGANPYAAADKLVYLSMIEQGREGILFMKNLHTVDPQIGLLLSPHWYLIGQTALLLDITNAGAYLLYRLLFAILFLWLLYVFLGKFFESDGQFFSAAGFILFSAGLGWLFVAIHPELLGALNTTMKFFYLPVDVYVTEGFTLLNFSQSPLFEASQLLLLFIGFAVVALDNRKPGMQDAGLSILAAFLIIMHPYDLPILLAALGTWAVARASQTSSYTPLIRVACIAAGCAAAALFNAYAIAREPVLQGWYEQNLVYSPHLSRYLWGYGMLMPLWVIGAIDIVLKKRNDRWWLFALAWSASIWLLLYLPLNVNRRFVNGWHIVLALVAYNGFRWLLSKSRQWIKILLASVVWVGLLSSLTLFLIINLYFDPSIYSYGYYYYTDAERHAAEFLRENTAQNANVLVSDAKTAFSISAQVPRAVFRGHDHQTPNALLRQQQLDWFLADQNTVSAFSRKQKFLQEQDISIIIINSSRLFESPRWIPNAPFLQEVYRSGELTVYRVVAS